LRAWKGKEYLYKIFSRLSTFEKNPFEELQSRTEFVHASNVWLDPIPNHPDAAVRLGVAACVDVELKKDESVDNNRGWKSETIVPPLIPPSFGKGYAVSIFDAKGRKVPDGHKTKPTFYYESCYLVFEEDPTKYFEPPFRVFGYAYVGRTLGDFTGSPQLYPLGAVLIPQEGGYVLEVSFVDVADEVAYVDVYALEDGQWKKVISDLPV